MIPPLCNGVDNEEDVVGYDPGLLDYPCTRVVTVVNAGAIKKRSPVHLGKTLGSQPPLPPHPASSRARGKAKCGEFEGREEERWKLLLEETRIFWRLEN